MTSTLLLAQAADAAGAAGGFSFALIVDIVVFVAFIGAVLTVAILMSRNEKDSESYFLAGRGLAWWLIGFSLIAANISTEQFVGMSGQAADYIGLAVASYEWMAAVTLVIVGFFFLPAFLRSGIYTIPEFLERRYGWGARTTMSIFTMLIYVFVTITAVIFSGATTIDVLAEEGTTILGIEINVMSASWAIGILAAVYVVTGGLKACAWADLLQGSALIVGGAIVMVLALNALGSADPTEVGLTPELAAEAGIENPESTAFTDSVRKFHAINEDKLNMLLPMDDDVLPWTALLLGLWIPNFYYWGLNQYIVQRTLGSKSLAEGQKGIVFAAALKLLIPFIVVVPGMIAFNLYSDDMRSEAIEQNQAVLTKLDQLGQTPFAEIPLEERSAFVFDQQFAEFYPERAQQVLMINAAVADKEVPDIDAEGDAAAAAMVQANQSLIEVIKVKNKQLPADQQIGTEKRLTGYYFDSAFGLLIKRLIPTGLRGFMLAAILGAVMSSLASMLNAASTIFTMDLFKQFAAPEASQTTLVFVGRLAVVVFVVVGCVISPYLEDPRFGGIFKYIQEFQGFISPGILAVFVFGFLIRKANRASGLVGLLLSPVLYGLLKWAAPMGESVGVTPVSSLGETLAAVSSISFLDRMAIVFFTILLVMTVMRFVAPSREDFELPRLSNLDLRTSKFAVIGGLVVILLTAYLYYVFCDFTVVWRDLASLFGGWAEYFESATMIK